MLSFNASVEAARAGEYGKGFAVVAEEVGMPREAIRLGAIDHVLHLDDIAQKAIQILSNSEVRVKKNQLS